MAFGVYVYENDTTEHDLTSYVIGKTSSVYDAEAAPFDLFVVNGITIAFDTTNISYTPDNDDYIIIYKDANILTTGYLKNKVSYFKTPVIRFSVVNEVETIKAAALATYIPEPQLRTRLINNTDIADVIGLDTESQNYITYNSIFDGWTYPAGSTANDLIFDTMLLLHAHYNAKTFFLNKIMYVKKEISTTTITAAEIIELEVNTQLYNHEAADYLNYTDFVKGTGTFNPTWGLPPKPFRYNMIEYQKNILYTTTDIAIGSNVLYNSVNYGHVIGKDASNNIVKYTLKKITRYYEEL